MKTRVNLTELTGYELSRNELLEVEGGNALQFIGGVLVMTGSGIGIVKTKGAGKKLGFGVTFATGWNMVTGSFQ